MCERMRRRICEFVLVFGITEAFEEQSWAQIEVGVPVQVLSSASTKTLDTSSTSRQAFEEQSWAQIEVGVPVQVPSSASTKTLDTSSTSRQAQSTESESLDTFEDQRPEARCEEFKHPRV